ncbi:sugar ABC transporter permease [candidate division KSB3 bacterium]|uniref:Sugar ABC transporter permease n=1 Tax=candidate division KSB3 bacterium TaxID=2044937 RepID=A0A2G6E2T5_9BACT|nr:MAG: sugar ABC transporter permease [candidate division KSB3 bacterium]PIE28889.1 MAG: sugar ABC transporter permease [candidate division KSB3 bacterium]
MIQNIFRTHEAVIAGILIAFTLLIGIVNPAFFTLENLFDLLKSSVVMGIFGIGVLIVLVSGGIDISFTAIAAFSMYVTGQILKGKLLLESPYKGTVLVAFVIAGLIGLLLGLLNAVFISCFKLPTLIVTLGTANAFRGFMLAFVGTRIITNLPRGWVRFSRSHLVQVSNDDGSKFFLSSAVILLLMFIAAAWFLLRYTMLGRGIYAIGGDRVAAERAGFNILRIQFFIYGFVGFLSGVVGVTHASLIRNANPFDLVGSELTVIAAVVLGGASITGGRGTVLGTLLGIFLIVIMNNSLILLGIPSYWQKVVIGLIIIISTGSTAYQSRKKREALS